MGLLLSAFGAATSLALSEEEIETRVRNLSDELRCPTCQAISVRDSSASFSVQIKEKVQRMVEEGQSDEEIKDYFVSRYGEWILRAPKKEGFGLVLWVLPIVAILGVGGWILFHLRRSARRAESAREEPTGEFSAEQLARIERDLKNFEEQD